MKGRQFSGLTAPAAANTNTRMAATLISTMMLFALALSRTPRTRIHVSAHDQSSAGQLKIAAGELPADDHGLRQLLRKMESE